MGHVTYTCIQSTWVDSGFQRSLGCGGRPHLTAKTKNNKKNKIGPDVGCLVIPAGLKVTLSKLGASLGSVEPCLQQEAAQLQYWDGGCPVPLSVCQHVCMLGGGSTTESLPQPLFLNYLKSTECSRCPKRWGREVELF